MRESRLTSQHNKNQVQISSLRPDTHSPVKDDPKPAVYLWMETADLGGLGGASSSSTMQEAEAEGREGDTEEDSEEDSVY